MNFRARTREEPEINLIPFIDVLLVVVIFLMLTTTYSKFTEMQLTLPVADTQAQRDYPKEVIVAISNDRAEAEPAQDRLGEERPDHAADPLDGEDDPDLRRGRAERLRHDDDHQRIAVAAEDHHPGLERQEAQHRVPG